jgi:hypothetical protein
MRQQGQFRCLIGIGVLVVVTSTFAEPFQNLSFDGVIGPLPAGWGWMPMEQAFPGWQIDVGGYRDTSVLYNSRRIGSPGATLMEQISRPTMTNFWIFLESGGYDTHLFQVGDVPSDGRTLLFDGQGTVFGVSVNGTTLALKTTEGGYAADISAFAGKTVKLSFDVPFEWVPIPMQNYLGLDNIRFSSVALVPEPSTSVLLALGGLGFGWKARRAGRVLRGIGGELDSHPNAPLA